MDPAFGYLHSFPHAGFACTYHYDVASNKAKRNAKKSSTSSPKVAKGTFGVSTVIG